MAKDRARDPKRVPSLGISDPISHVKVVKGSKHGMELFGGSKFDALGSTDESRAAGAKGYDDRVSGINFVNKIREKTPVVKINTDPTDK